MYQINELQKYKGLFHVFSEKSDGNMANAIGGVVYDFPDVYQNRVKFFNKINADIDKSVCMWVTHGDQIIEPPVESVGVSMRDYSKALKVDGLMTNKPGLYLFLLIADCIPLIIYDPVVGAVGLIHAGWKGVDMEIAGKGVSEFKSRYKSKTKNLIIGIGPCARKESFIKEKPEQLEDPRWKDYITPLHNGHLERQKGVEGSQRKEVLHCIQNDSEGDGVNLYHIDLVGFTKRQLLNEGVMEKNIFDCGIDTVTDDRFFSHVRDVNSHISRQGRFACVIGLIKD